MNSAAARNALRQYKQIGTSSGIESASPHRVIQMLMDGGLARLKAASLHIQRGEIAAKGESIGFAISIISGLQASLDAEAGGDIATNLDRLYDYMIRTLISANLDNNAQQIDEVTELLAQIKQGWDGIDGAG